MKALIVGILLAVTGCAGMDESKEHTAPLNLWPSSENGLADQVEKWADRWSAATGLTILVGTGGTPVTFEDDLPNLKRHNQDCGVTQTETIHGMWVATDTVKIHRDIPPGCPAWGYTLGHELGHAVSACQHAEDALDVLMSSRISKVPHWIDAESLAVVCLTVDCLSFNPESEAAY